MHKSYQDACELGMTPTGNLPDEIVNASYRMTAILRNGAVFGSQTKSFSQLPPAEGQYDEITFQQMNCDRISRVEVSDPGRCAVGDMNRLNSKPGDCAKFTDLAPGGLVPFEWKKK